MSAWKQKASKGGGDYEKAPAGNHPAVLVAMIDMGTQENEFNGEVKEQHRVFWVWELVNEKTKAGGNHLIGMDLTFSLNDKAKMRAFIEARIGRPIRDDEEYDIAGELGQPCLLNVVEKNGYPKVAGVSAVPKGMTVASPAHPLTSWHLDEFEKTGTISLPNWIPYLYGEPLPAHISRAGEMAGRTVAPSQPATTSTPTQQAPSAPAAPTQNPPRPPAPPGAPKPLQRFYIAFADGSVSALMNADETAHTLLSKGMTVESLVCPEGGQEWKPASTFGITLPF